MSVVRRILNAARPPQPKAAPARPAKSKPQTWCEIDEEFHRFYDRAIVATGSEEQRKAFPERLYNTMQAFNSVAHLEGWVAECGCFRGQTSHLFCDYQSKYRPGFAGEQFQVFDSFQGLSAPTEEDLLMVDGELKPGNATCKAGAYAAPLDHVKKSLAAFPKIEFHPGWIPESLSPSVGQTYKFVHLDLDLYEPNKGALEFFYPRMVPGGIIALDDYGFIRWPGARRAADEFCAAQNVRLISLTTGNALLIKPATNS